MSCLDTTKCPADQIYNRIVCNFTYSHVKFVCNSTITCRRADGLYDCCTSNISYCTMEIYMINLLPTIAPTLDPNPDSVCENICNLTPSINKCYWYESQNLDISCIGRDNQYCCSHSHGECCQTNMLYVYFSYGIVFFVIISCLTYYNYIGIKYRRVIPEEASP